MKLNEAFWKILDDLPRQAPGSDATTRFLLGMTGKTSGNCLEIGCGQGRASMLLARTGFDITATDIHQPYLDELEAAAKAAGLKDKISTRNISMDRMDYPDESFEMIWSEGAAYVIGWGRAIGLWKRLLKPGGLLVATECCWLTETPSDEAKQFWAEGYPTMLSVEAAVDTALRQGYTLIDRYILPESDWFDEYYTPMKQKHAMLSIDAGEDMQRAIASGRLEIELYENHGDEYGYVGFIVRKA